MTEQQQAALNALVDNERELGIQMQPADEPVAMRHSFDGYGWKYTDMGFGSGWKEWTLKQHPDAEPVYDRPRPAAWVGLTDEEIVLVCADCAASAHRHDDISYARAIEAMLREKNGGGV